MRVAVLKADAAARRARDKAQLQKVWLVNVLDGVDVLVDRRGQRLQPRRPAAEFFDKRQKQISVRLIEPQRIDLQPFQGDCASASVTASLPFTAEKSRTRLSNRLAIRGVPRLRRAISAAASRSMVIFSAAAEWETIFSSSAGEYISRRLMMPNLSRKGEASIPARVVAPIRVNFFKEKRIFRADGPLPTMMSRA